MTMPSSKLPRPTDAELDILNVLWREGPSTVRQVHDELKGKDIGYTTVLKLMQIMVEKGLLRRDTSQRSHVYRAAVARHVTQRQLAGDLMRRAFSGSAHELVMSALSAKPASADELQQLRELLQQLEREKGQ